MACSKCGTENMDGAKFCRGCGTPLSNQNIHNVEAIELTKTIDINQLNASDYSQRPPEPKKTKKNLKLKISKPVIIIILSALVIVLGAFFAVKLMFKNEMMWEYRATSFFVENKDGKLALFSKDGNKLTNFKFSDSGSNFIAGSSLVKQGDKYGVINEDGKQLLDNTHGYIARIGSLYGISNEETYFYFTYEAYYDAFGNKLEASRVYDINENVALVYSKDGKNISLYGYDSKPYFTAAITAESEVDYDDDFDYVVLSVDNKVYLFNKYGTKKLKEIDFSGVKDNYVSITQDYSDEDVKVIYYKDDKYSYTYMVGDKIVSQEINACEAIMLKNSNFVCENESKSIIIGKDGAEAEYNDDAYYFDAKHYLLEKDNNVEFYTNGKLTKTLECYQNDSFYNPISSGVATLEGINYGDCENDRDTSLFDQNGNMVGTLELYSIGYFSKDGYTIGYTDSYDYYILNNKGKIISEKFKNLDDDTLAGKTYYLAETTDLNAKDKIVILDNNLKKIFEGEYESVSLDIRNGKRYATVTKGDDYTLVDLASGKTTFTYDYDKQVEKYEDYIVLENGNKLEYYMYNGKMIYSEEK